MYVFAVCSAVVNSTHLFSLMVHRRYLLVSPGLVPLLRRRFQQCQRRYFLLQKCHRSLSIKWQSIPLLMSKNRNEGEILFIFVWFYHIYDVFQSTSRWWWCKTIVEKQCRYHIIRQSSTTSTDDDIERWTIPIRSSIIGILVVYIQMICLFQNEGVVSWCHQHIVDNPYVDLVCRFYIDFSIFTYEFIL